MAEEERGVSLSEELEEVSALQKKKRVLSEEKRVLFCLMKERGVTSVQD